jgi:hypothetical protein
MLGSCQHCYGRRALIHTKQHRCNHRVRIEATFFGDIAEGDLIELRGIASTSGVDREQDRPCQTASKGTNNHNHPQIPQKQIGFQGRMSKDKLVIQNSKVVKPGDDGVA